MRILVVDDTEAVLLLISRFVEALGHVAIPARDGGEAIRIWREIRPDLVLMDMMMPVVSGAEAAATIKAEAGETWVPIVFVTGIGEESRLAEAIEQGADDYINKPVNLRVLEAKLKAFQRTLALNRKVREQSAKLADYYARAEEEKRVVQHLMEQMVNAERLSDAQLEYWLSPAESLSGDMIAAARTPGQVLHLMLADGIGHGLTAALNVLPLTQPFYSMTEKGYAIPDILVEMSKKVRQVLPIGRFVAVVLIAIDEANGCIEVWNGGMPTVLVVDDAGEVCHRWASRHLPLGITETHDVETVTERFYFDSPGTVVAYSDGLIEARSADGHSFGLPRLQQLLKVSARRRLAGVQAELDAHLVDTAHHDDISLVLGHFGARLRGVAAEEGRHLSPAVLSALLKVGEPAWQYALQLGAAELKYLNTVPFMMSFINEIRVLVPHQSDVFLILTELFTNALDHGLLRLDASQKQAPGGRERYLAARTRGLEQLESGRIDIELTGLRSGGQNVLKIHVCDTGPGFDWRAGVTATDVAHVQGTGLALVRALSSALIFRDPGNDVVAYYLLDTPPA
ncbi:fused response regulator/phosphatase [Jeongeupia naejangsanensis]|uniref:Fused response regulator/phosphatase n=1 Tax=Jeongeupia naejangsanensis TaxID=613195 RepID=A0ABS2BJF3_9NEIS|nr:fused response regulator/phosphatase [Jeongeupia naejangsanensis]MBM3115223.1 fused response regulator/phosphatase [Jeongeupia naejangsanensis]